MSVDTFQVSLGAHLLSGFVHHTPWLWRALAGLESRSLRARIDQVEIDRPVWVSGIARSGSTILLEILASHPDVATHQYRDFPFASIPYWWRTTLQNAGTPDETPEERAHGDRLLVTPSSPEAMEEPLWMMHFDHLHDPSRSSVLDRQTSNPKFEAFFADHLRKLMLVMRRSRYLAKANYNVTRLAYLHRQFPTARFIVPVRDPRTHIASLRKQHRLFSEAAEKYPRSVAHLNRVGHFEFGANRTPINANDEAVAEVQRLWAAGEEVRGWARYWAHLYGFLLRQLEDDAALAEAVLLVRYEDLCADSERWLGQIFEHTALPQADAIISVNAGRLSPPTYYSADYSAEELIAISEECGEVAAALDYDLGIDTPAVAPDAPRVS